MPRALDPSIQFQKHDPIKSPMPHADPRPRPLPDVFGQNRSNPCMTPETENIRSRPQGAFSSARGVEDKGLDTRHSTDQQVREICADDLRWDGRP